MISIYKLIDPFSKNVRYIGKTKKSLKKRLYEHLTQRNLLPNNHKNNWIKQVLAHGGKPIIDLIEILPDEHWQEREIFWIKSFRAKGCNLTNSTEGGEGATGSKKSLEAVLRGIETKRQNGTLKRSIECRKRISQANSGRTSSPAAIEATAIKIRKKLYQFDSHGTLLQTYAGIRKYCREFNVERNKLNRVLKQKTLFNNCYWSTEPFYPS